MIFAGFTSTNTLFRHEIAFVLGQIQSESSKDVLYNRLRDTKENDMVRYYPHKPRNVIKSNWKPR